MIPHTKRCLVAAVSLCASFPAFANVDEQKTYATKNSIEEVFVYGQQGATNVATRLDLSIMETPQMVTTISRLQLDDFALTGIDDVLEYAPGVTVEQIETDRTYFTARGFDVVNFQYDGVGTPFVAGLNHGQQDTAIYERVEVVKGAAGLITGLANPSATINFVRKRPTEEFQASAGLTVGQWSHSRLDGDVSGSFSPAVRGRVVVALDQGNSYLDRHEDETQLFYGVLDFDMTDTTKLTVGHSYDNSHSTGVLWGALPLTYTDGSQTNYDVSTNNAPDWTFADNVQQQTFVELEQKIGDNWSFHAHLVRSQGEYDSELFYTWGVPAADTEIGLSGYASAYNSDEEQTNVELFFTGDVQLFERDHQLVVGYSHSSTEQTQGSYYNYAQGYPVLGADWAEGNTPSMAFPDHNPLTDAGDLDITQKAFYVAALINPHDDVSILAGVRNNDLEQKGITYGGDAAADASELVPYFGATWEVIEDLVLYTSYSEVFKQQTWVDVDYKPLGATLGSSSELGIKKSFNDERATLSFAFFESEQENFGEFVVRDENNIAIYEAVALESSGFELEFVGEVTEGLHIAAGYTDLSVEDKDGKEARPFIPKKQLTLSATYQLPVLANLRISGVLKHQDDITTPDELAAQDAYITLNLAAHYQVTPDLGVSLNIANATDKKYLNSLYWDQAYYAAPRNVSASARWHF